MPKTDLVPCFYAGSDRAGKPDFVKERSELHAWRDQGQGYFCDHGTRFQMTRSVAAPERGISSRAAAVAFSRVQNKLQKPTVSNYPIPAMGDHRLRWFQWFMIPESVKAESY